MTTNKKIFMDRISWYKESVNFNGSDSEFKDLVFKAVSDGLITECELTNHKIFSKIYFESVQCDLSNDKDEVYTDTIEPEKFDTEQQVASQEVSEINLDKAVKEFCLDIDEQIGKVTDKK